MASPTVSFQFQGECGKKRRGDKKIASENLVVRRAFKDAIKPMDKASEAILGSNR